MDLCIELCNFFLNVFNEMYMLLHIVYSVEWCPVLYSYLYLKF